MSREAMLENACRVCLLELRLLLRLLLQGLSEVSRYETIVGSSESLMRLARLRGFRCSRLRGFLKLSLSLFGYNPKAFSAAAMLPKR